MKWICLPGWATEAQLLSDLLPESAEKIEVDFNFFRDEAFPTVNEIQQHIPEEDYAIICFSMGTLFALELCKIKQPKHFLCIGGFSSFCGFDEMTKKQRSLSCRQMIRQLKRSPQTIVAGFRQQTELSSLAIPDFYNSKNLIHGLELLISEDLCEISENIELNLDLLISPQDSTVPESISRQLLNGPGIRKVHQLRGAHGFLIKEREFIKSLLEYSI